MQLLVQIIIVLWEKNFNYVSVYMKMISPYS